MTRINSDFREIGMEHYLSDASNVFVKMDAKNADVFGRTFATTSPFEGLTPFLS